LSLALIIQLFVHIYKAAPGSEDSTRGSIRFLIKEALPGSDATRAPRESPMLENPQELIRPRPIVRLVGAFVVAAAVVAAVVTAFGWDEASRPSEAPLRYKPRMEVETSGIEAVTRKLKPWKSDASLEE